MLDLFPQTFSFLLAECIQDHLFIYWLSHRAVCSHLYGLFVSFPVMAQCFQGRLDWPQLVMDHCFLVQLRLVYLWLHKSLPHKIRKRGFVPVPDPPPCCCTDHHPSCFPAAPGTMETLCYCLCSAWHWHPVSHDLADCGSFTYHSGGMIIHSFSSLHPTCATVLT